MILCLHQSYDWVHMLTSETICPFNLSEFSFLLGLSILIKVTHYFKLKLLKLNNVEILDCSKFIVLSLAVHTLREKKKDMENISMAPITTNTNS